MRSRAVSAIAVCGCTSAATLSQLQAPILPWMRGSLLLTQLIRLIICSGLKPLNVVQPEGPSFTVTEGNHVQWQQWDFRVTFNYREGLVLHQIG